MTTDEIRRYLELLGAELQRQQVTGEIVLVGGAVMLLVIGNRPTTRDIDAYFATDAQIIREAARIVAEREHLPPDWINDAAKGFFYSQPPTTLWLEFPGLRVYVANPDYVLAMKAVAGRPADLPDIMALAEHLGLSRAGDILSVVGRYVPPARIAARTQFLIESLFPGVTVVEYHWQRQTIADTYERILREPAHAWVAIGDFLDDWRRSAREDRLCLVAAPIVEAPSQLPSRRWAAFCAAMVEWLCWLDGLPCPTWTSQERYRLAEPWFLYPGEPLRAWQLATTPAPFKLRNIFGGDHILSRA